LTKFVCADTSGVIDVCVVAGPVGVIEVLSVAEAVGVVVVTGFAKNPLVSTGFAIVVVAPFNGITGGDAIVVVSIGITLLPEFRGVMLIGATAGVSIVPGTIALV